MELLAQTLQDLEDHGLTRIIAWAVVIGAIAACGALAKLMHTYLKSDGVIPQWFIGSLKRQAQVADAVEAMPAAITALKETGETHHHAMLTKLSELVDITRHGQREVCAFHEGAAQLDGVFSTHYSNQGLAEMAEAFAVLLEWAHDKHPEAIADPRVSRAARHVEDAMRAFKRGVQNHE